MVQQIVWQNSTYVLIYDNKYNKYNFGAIL